MRKLYVPLPEHEIAALKALAEQERRRPQDQAAVLLVQALQPFGGNASGVPRPASRHRMEPAVERPSDDAA